MSGILDFYIYVYPISISFVHNRKRKSHLRFCPSSPTRRKIKQYSSLKRIFSAWLCYSKIKLSFKIINFIQEVQRNAYNQMFTSCESHQLLIHALFISMFSREKMQLASHLLIRYIASYPLAFRWILIYETQVKLSPNMKVFTDFYKPSYFQVRKAG